MPLSVLIFLTLGYYNNFAQTTTQHDEIDTISVLKYQSALNFVSQYLQKKRPNYCPVTHKMAVPNKGPIAKTCTTMNYYYQLS